MLRCDVCGCSSPNARGWVTYLVRDPDDEACSLAVAFCPPCAAKEAEIKPREPLYL